MDSKLQDLLNSIVITSTAGAGGPVARSVIKGFALPRHGMSIDKIDEAMSPTALTRVHAIARILGLRNFSDPYANTSVGVKYISHCINKKLLIMNQFKKWHYINPLNLDAEAIDFDVYPYWILVEFLCIIQELLGTTEISSTDFLIFITSIRDRNDIFKHAEAYTIAKRNPSNYTDFMTKIPSTTNDKFTKGHWNQIFEIGYFEHIAYDKSTKTISLKRDLDCTDIKYKIDHFYTNYTFNAYNSVNDEYTAFLQNEIEDDNIFDDSNIAAKYTDLSVSDLESLSSNLENNFPFKNILLKGVPGTGKSHLLTEVVKNKIFKFKDPELRTCISQASLIQDNVLRINIHSASSNADLMQGIGISTDTDSKIIYNEKKGLIYKHIQKACYTPSLPFVLILEEIQENSLNELIGDLIYLIELSKRAKIQDLTPFDASIYSFEELVDIYLKELDAPSYVTLPSLIDIHKVQKMIIPDNLYVFCTSNYRDDKKVIEDNLLRRFSVIEVYPQYQEALGEEVFKSKNISNFLSDLNTKVLEIFNEEMHSDRYLLGHANWLDIDETEENIFYEALLKVFIEFKEIKEIEFHDGVDKLLEHICDNKTNYGTWVEKVLELFCSSDREITDYINIVTILQNEIYKDFLPIPKMNESESETNDNSEENSDS